MTVYIVTCWLFSAMRAFHTCQQPKKNRSYIWPDRKLQIIIYSMATLLLPYVFDPTSPSAWLLVKSYFPATYYFYCGVLMFMFFGTVKQRSRWKNISWVFAIFIIIAMTPLVINAWVPGEVLSAKGIEMQQWIVLAVSLLSIPYCLFSMWKVWGCIAEARDDNYSNPDDFPLAYAQRVWLSPLFLTPFLWPAFLTDNPTVLAYMLLPLSVFNVILLLTVMPVWRRGVILSQNIDDETEADAETEVREHVLMEERMDEIAKKIEEYVDEQKGYLNPHLKIDQVVEYCATNRTYVSRTFKERFGGFFNYVNRLRLDHYERYMQQNKTATKDLAAQESGFSSYQAYYNASRRLQ
jgi:AraC-like DNA-binding protein